MSVPVPFQLAAAALAVLGAGAAGTALALTGVVTAPEVAVVDLVEARTASAYDCVDGAPVASLPAGQRVVVTARSGDSAWFGLSDPAAPAQTVWLPARLLTFDDAPDPALPVGGECPVMTVTLDGDEVVPVDPDPVDPADPVGPTPIAPDTSAPQLSGVAASPAAIACDAGYGLPTTTTVSVTATDNRGVASVTVSWSGRESGSATMTGSGSTYSTVFDPGNAGMPGTVTFQITARDAAGNTSAVASTSVSVDCLG